MVRRRVQPQCCRKMLLLLLLLLLVKELRVVGGKLILDQILRELKIEITHKRPEKIIRVEMQKNSLLPHLPQ